MDDDFDVIIIGCGIGGLICGAYLSKNGLKVLCIEKNNVLGGYCQSYIKNGYVFSKCIRGFVGYRNDGVFYKIINELDLINRLKILRPEVYDTIQFLGNTVSLHNDPMRTVEEIKELFPDEDSAIDRFFSLFTKKDIAFELYKYKNLSFDDLVSSYFKNEKLKFLLNILRIDSGEDPKKTSAIADLMLIRGNIFDGGYYPKGGMHRIPELLGEYIIEKGGKIIKGVSVKNIRTHNSQCVGVIIEGNKLIKARTIVSNCDARFTFNHLLKDSSVSESIIRNINNLVPSTSTFIMYLGVKTSLERYLKYKCAAVWNFSKNIADGIVATLPSLIDKTSAPQGCSSVTIYYGAPFKDKDYWSKNKNKYSDTFLKRFLRIFPDIKNDIEFVEIVTPVDLENMTNNYCGASRGWAPLIQQIRKGFPNTQTSIENLYLVGHWVMSDFGNGGISFAAQTGKKVANIIIKKFKKQLN